MKRASAPGYDLFKLMVAAILVLILLLMLLRGCATLPAAPAVTESPTAPVAAASVTATAVDTETEPAAPSATPTAIEPTITPTAAAVISSPTPAATTSPPTDSETPTAGSTQDAACNTSVPSRLSVGDTARVLQRLNMRSQPMITAQILQTNSIGTQVEIIGGPVCTPVGDRAYLWWQIHLSNGSEGWSAEAPLNEATYLLEPAK
jgi:hypothetical protein